MPSSGPSAHAVLVRSIVAGVCAAVLGLCIFIWVIYILHRWWAVRAEALRPRVNVNGVEREFPASSRSSAEESVDHSDHSVHNEK
ncbi:hypothetical protein C8Q76DRAFT_804329 [Earliella scabrosa]|nr:hypothetical protein C8Q76DRAFT_804329 [Earliella scabrosa]